jgi:hypothetical protein
MATTKEKAAPETNSNIIPLSAAGLPADLLADAEALAGMGTSASADDNIIPFLSLLQDMSPEAKKRDPKYVEGAEPGFILNKASRQIWGPNDLLEVQPCAFDRTIVEWVPRDNGGGFVARHTLLPAGPDATMRSLGAKEQPDPRDPKKVRWVLPNGNELIDTRYHFVNIVHPDGRLEPVVMSFSSTGHSVSRQWMTLMRQAQVPTSKGPAVAPSFFKKYRVTAAPRKNNKGEFFVLDFKDAGWIHDAGVRAAGKALHDSVKAGDVKAGDEEAQGSVDVDAGAPDDLPI